MSIINREIYKKLEWHLFHYFDIRREVKEYRDTVLNSSPPEFGEWGGGVSYHSDPTAIKAIRLVKPEIREKEKWIEIVEKTKAHFENTDKGRLLQMKYFDEEGPGYIQRKLHIDRATYFRWKNEIILYMALLAQKYNLIDIEKVS